MKFENRAKASKLTGLSYIGSTSISSKHEKAEDYLELTYAIYLAPAKQSGYETCPMRTEECTLLCLNESGHNRIDKGRITEARIKKTKLFFEHRSFFVDWVIAEIKAAKSKADKLGYKFSVRLNNTSDINPEMFYTYRGDEKMNLFQIFPHIQFYDYTKVKRRLDLTKKYSNYDLTFSFSGENLTECEDALKSGTRVAMVFTEVPEVYMGYNVVSGDNYDMRYKDPKNVIVGLKYKKVRTKLMKETKFVIQNNNG